MVGKPFRVFVAAVPTKMVHYSPERTSVSLSNLGTATVFLGVDAEVTVNNGYPLLPNATITFAPGFGDDPRVERFGVAAFGIQDVRVSEEQKSDKED